MYLTEEHKRRLLLQASEVREETIRLIYHGNGGHIGGDLSEADLLVAIFDYMKHDVTKPDQVERDRFVLSKGHAAEAYYTILHKYGYIDDDDMEQFGSFGAKLGGHPNVKIAGVDVCTGSLGHGLGLATGMALALKKDGRSNRVFVLTGDGELAEGSVWEAAMSAAKYRLDNLTWLIDRNGLQISGSTEEVMPLDSLEMKAKAFGFHTSVIDGHDMEEIYGALSERSKGKPACIIAKTIKGKGLPEAENQASWHHKTPTAEQVEAVSQAMQAYREEVQRHGNV